jgi:hypothetical protein
MSTSVLYANAVDVLLKYLRPADPGTEFGTTLDGSSPSFVALRRVGGVAERVTDRPRIDLLIRQTSEFKAQELAQTLRQLLLFDLPGRTVDGHTVYDVTEFAGPTAYPDPAGSDLPVVLLTLEVGIRGASS